MYCNRLETSLCWSILPIRDYIPTCTLPRKILIICRHCLCRKNSFVINNFLLRLKITDAQYNFIVDKNVKIWNKILNLKFVYCNRLETERSVKAVSAYCSRMETELIVTALKNPIISWKHQLHCNHQLQQSAICVHQLYQHPAYCNEFWNPSYKPSFLSVLIVSCRFIYPG